jgi:hypothetical protein
MAIVGTQAELILVSAHCQGRLGGSACREEVVLYRLDEMRDRTFENRRYRASGLNLVVAAIILWNTIYLEPAIRLLQQKGSGLDRWNGYEKVDATIVSGGGFFPLKGVLQDSNPRCMSVWLHEDVRLSFPTELPISARCSRQRGSPLRSSMARRLPSAMRPGTPLPATSMSTPWGPLHRA